MKSLKVKSLLMFGAVGVGFILLAQRSRPVAIGSLITGLAVGTITGTISRNRRRI